MSIMEKRIFTNINDVKSYLQSIGFTITNNKILWSHAELDTACYWKIEDDIITFQRSDGENAFEHNLVDFNMEDRPKCGIASIKLQDNGIALYMGMITETSTIGDVTICCQNRNTVLNNGLVVLSPSDADGHWYYSWTKKYTITNNDFPCWCFDNGHGSLEINSGDNNDNCQVSTRPILVMPNNIVLNRVYLNTGYWSNNIKELVLGETTPPASVFKLQGQKYIAFSTISNYRCPVYKLASEGIEPNLSTSTDPYSSLKTYVVGDYCTFNGYVYRCTTSIQTPEPFDDSKWVQTTVPNELLTAGDYIYGA